MEIQEARSQVDAPEVDPLCICRFTFAGRNLRDDPLAFHQQASGDGLRSFGVEQLGVREQDAGQEGILNR